MVRETAYLSAPQSTANHLYLVNENPIAKMQKNRRGSMKTQPPALAPIVPAMYSQGRLQPPRDLVI